VTLVAGAAAALAEESCADVPMTKPMIHDTGPTTAAPRIIGTFERFLVQGCRGR